LQRLDLKQHPDQEAQPDSWLWLPHDDSLTLGPMLRQRLAVASAPATMTGTWFLGRLHSDDHDRHLAEMMRHFKGAENFVCASRIRDVNDLDCWIYLEGNAKRDLHNRVIQVGGFAHLLVPNMVRPGDTGKAAELQIRMTDLLSAGVAALEGRETEQARRLLAEENAFSQREFLSMVSHEIRNPLTVIFANISMMRARAERDRDSDLLNRLSTLEKSGRHLRDIVSDVLDLAKAEAGHLQAELSWFDLEPLLQEIEEMSNALTSESGVMFLLDMPTDCGRMFGDRLKLKQILLNLVNNAVKFTKHGRIMLTVVDERSSLIFSVQDTGPGIPRERLDDLFKAFSQVNGSHAPRSSGTGLGLYICDRYVRMLGGRLSVSSTLGEGSTFDFALPRVNLKEADLIPPLRRDDRLVIGHTEDLGTLDPHRQIRSTNAMIARHHFESLTSLNAAGRLAPGLAESWEPIRDDGWRFHLRRGVRFHNGHEFDASDVLATFERLTEVIGANGPYAAFLKPVRKIAAPDQYTLEMYTSVVSPLLPIDLSHIAIIHRDHRNADAHAFDNLLATVGTGPFRLKSRSGNRALLYEGFAEYWAGQPEWRELEFRLIDESGLASVSALLAGEVDLIDNVGPDQLVELKRRGDVNLATCVSNRVWYLFFDQYRDSSPWITDRQGVQLPDNPLKDPRVRRAISLAIDRDFIATHLMAGQGLPVGDVAGPGVFGVNPSLAPSPYDPRTARLLLDEAGYPEGFAIVLHGSRDRSFHGATTLRAIGLMLNAVGILCKSEALPAAEFYPRAARGEFSFGLSGWGSITGETSYSLRLLLCSPDTPNGFGGVNRGGYSNSHFDALVCEAVGTMDDAKRRRLLEQASKIAMDEVAIAPICARKTTWATKLGITYHPQADGSTLAIAAARTPNEAG
jgi:peptide/nickel transport system substrate-binding protein